MDVHSAYFVTNLNRAECASRRKDQSAFEGRERGGILSVRLKGSEFQMVGPAYTNTRDLYVASLTRGKSRWPWSAERRCSRPGTPETG